MNRKGLEDSGDEQPPTVRKSRQPVDVESHSEEQQFEELLLSDEDVSPRVVTTQVQADNDDLLEKKKAKLQEEDERERKTQRFNATPTKSRITEKEGLCFAPIMAEDNLMDDDPVEIMLTRRRQKDPGEADKDVESNHSNVSEDSIGAVGVPGINPSSDDDVVATWRAQVSVPVAEVVHDSPNVPVFQAEEIRNNTRTKLIIAGAALCTIVAVTVGILLLAPAPPSVPPPPSSSPTTAPTSQPPLTTLSDILTVFYKSTNGDDWTFNDQWLSGLSPCRWHGILCETIDGEEVIKIINMWNNELSGTLPSAIGLLTDLTSLILGGNTNVTGTIPTELGRLSLLDGLDFTQNSMTGPIPSEFGRLVRLTRLDLYPGVRDADRTGNLFTGTIPTELGLLTELNLVAFNQHNFEGRFPSEFGNLALLSYLDLSDSGLTGPIPTEIGLLTSMATFFSTNNGLTGSIPTEVGLLTQLASLYLGKNNLNGRIPTEVGHLTQMAKLDIWGNNLSGPIPTEIGRLTELDLIGFEFNFLTGLIPTELGLLTGLTSLSLQGNCLSGNLSSTVCETAEVVFAAADCGDIPSAVDCSCCKTTGICEILDNVNCT